VQRYDSAWRYNARMMNLNEHSAIPATTRGSDWFRLTITSFLISLTMLAAPHYSHTQEVQNKSWVGYYPLAMGNAWTYRVSGNSETRPTVWRVINVKPDASGPVFAVWPTPSNSDDEGMNLQFTSEGLHESNYDFFVLRFPITKGNTWSVSRHDQKRVFLVLSEGERCAVGKFKFQSCAVVRDDDPEVKLRIVTTYALGVGPVQYEYYKLLRDGAATEATQVLRIVSFSVKPSERSPQPKS